MGKGDQILRRRKELKMGKSGHARSRQPSAQGRRNRAGSRDETLCPGLMVRFFRVAAATLSSIGNFLRAKPRV
jgi:hypothetical protein